MHLLPLYSTDQQNQILSRIDHKTEDNDLSQFQNISINQIFLSITQCKTLWEPSHTFYNECIIVYLAPRANFGIFNPS